MTFHASPLHAAETVEPTSAMGSSVFNVCEIIVSIQKVAEMLNKAKIHTIKIIKAQHHGAHQQYIILHINPDSIDSISFRVALRIGPYSCTLPYLFSAPKRENDDENLDNGGTCTNAKV